MKPKLHFWVPGVPAPQGSSRAFVRGNRAVVTSANPRLKSWRHDVMMAAQNALGSDMALQGPVELELLFLYNRPAGHFGKRGLLPSAPVAKTTQPDLDKLVRGMCDALKQAGAYRDDALVIRIGAAKRFTTGNELPGARVSLWEVEEPAAESAA